MPSTLRKEHDETWLRLRQLTAFVEADASFVRADTADGGRHSRT